MGYRKKLKGNKNIFLLNAKYKILCDAVQTIHRRKCIHFKVVEKE